MLNSMITGALTVTQLLILLGTGLGLGLLLALIFRFKQTISTGFMMALTLLPPVVTVIIMLVNGNIGAGLCVAGTFALIRFRSAAGSAREIIAVFCATALGLALGMGYIWIACILFGLIAVCVLGYTILGTREASSQKRLRVTIPENIDYNGLFDDLFMRYGVKADLIKVKNAAMGTLFELTYVITVKNNIIPKALLDEMRVLNCNQSIIIGPVREKDSL